jgi:hypothetical protein
MSWAIVVRPEAGDDVMEAAAWYDQRRRGLGDEFVEEVLRVYDSLKYSPKIRPVA